MRHILSVLLFLLKITNSEYCLLRIIFVDKKVRDSSAETVAEDLNITVEGMGLSGGRTSYVPAMTASQRKNRRQRGLPYTNRKHKDVAPPQFKYITCKCANDCDDLTQEMRRQLYEDFWRMGSWDAQSSFLRSTMKEV